MKYLIIFLNIGFGMAFGAQNSSPSSLYNSLDPLSISQHLAFYELYADREEGRTAFNHAWQLLTGQMHSTDAFALRETSLSGAIDALVALVNKRSTEDLPKISLADLTVIEKLAAHLPNRALKGYKAKKEADVLALPVSEIDLAHGLLLSQFGESNDSLQQIRTYEASLDLMALQIRARLPQNAAPAAKIRMMNDFIFGEMGFRFPPHSSYAKDVDIYTFLPAVLDSRRGVCLGVSVLYICLAQRLGLSLEMVTPPGHIYVRYRGEGQTVNIETTARGIHMDTEEYLTVNNRALKERNVKEVIGLTYFNQASVFLAREQFAEALAAYQRALPYLTDDLQLLELMAYQYLLTGQTEEGVRILRSVQGKVPDEEISGDTVSVDYLNGDVDIEGIKTMFMHVDENRSSVLLKRDAILKTLAKFPKFAAGYFYLATTWLQLHRHGEALAALEQFHRLVDNDPTAEYYMTVLYAERDDYNNAWRHLHNAERITKAKGYEPRLLKELHRELSRLSPE